MLFELFRDKTVALTSDQHADQVIQQQEKYWAKLNANLFLHATLVFFAIGVPISALELIRFAIAATTGHELVRVGFVLSGSTALAAFGVLATLIVALQISVRTPAPGDDQSAADARQMILETLARLCGASAVAIGVAAALDHLPSLTFLDSVRFLGPLAGAYLLALFAADAASASNARLSRAITEANRRAYVVTLKQAAIDVSNQTKGQKWWVYGFELLAVLVAAPVAIIAAVFIAWNDEAFSFWNFAAIVGYFSAFTLLAVIVLVLARNQWFRRDRLAAAYWIALFVASLGGMALMAWLVQLATAPEDARAVIQRVSIALGVTTIWFLMCASLAWRVPFSSRRGFGAAVLIQLLLRTSRREEAQSSLNVPWRTVGSVALCLVTPPVGLYFTYKARQAADDSDRNDSSVAAAASAPLLRIGYLAMASWVVVPGIIYAINPSFG